MTSTLAFEASHRGISNIIELCHDIGLTIRIQSLSKPQRSSEHPAKRIWQEIQQMIPAVWRQLPVPESTADFPSDLTAMIVRSANTAYSVRDLSTMAVYACHHQEVDEFQSVAASTPFNLMQVLIHSDACELPTVLATAAVLLARYRIVSEREEWLPAEDNDRIQTWECVVELHSFLYSFATDFLAFLEEHDLVSPECAVEFAFLAEELGCPARSKWACEKFAVEEPDVPCSVFDCRQAFDGGQWNNCVIAAKRIASEHPEWFGCVYDYYCSALRRLEASDDTAINNPPHMTHQGNSHAALFLADELLKSHARCLEWCFEIMLRVDTPAALRAIYRFPERYYTVMVQTMIADAWKRVYCHTIGESAAVTSVV